MEKKKTDLKEILSFLLILAGSAILAINMNTFVEQGGLVPGGFSGRLPAPGYVPHRQA